MKNTNKGMAFVTVLIATMFIGLLATSLCFMAYNNYLTKSTRWSAENNFYYDEFALNELTTAMRQQADKVSLDKVADFNNNPPADPAAVAPDPLKEFYKELAHCTGVKNGAGVEDDGNYNGVFVGTWDPAKMNDLIGSLGITNTFDSSDTETRDTTMGFSNVIVNVSVPNEAGGTRNDPVYKRDKKEVLFKNVRITVTDKKSGYTTTITTDILMPTKGVSAKIPVNEFCIMSDSPIEWKCGGIVHVGGNVFSIDNYSVSNHSLSGTGKYAAVFDKSTQITLGGRKSMFVGDVHVTGNSRLTLYNEVTITGKLIVDPGSRVECNGSNIKIGEVPESSKSNIVGSYVEDPTMKDRASSTFNGSTGVLKNGLASAIPNDVYFIKSFNTTDNSFAKVEYKQSSTNKSSFDAMSKVKNSDVANTTMQYGTSADIMIRINSNDITDQHDKLIFMPGTSQKIRGDYKNTTIIAPTGSPISSDDPTKVPYMTRMSDADYYACLNSLIVSNDAQNCKPTLGSESGVNLNTTVGYNGTIDDFNAIIAKSKLTPGDPGYDASFSDKYYVAAMPTLGKESRYYVYDKINGKQLIPWKYFIRDDADEIIGDAFNNIRNDSSDGGEYNIVFVNWVKE